MGKSKSKKKNGQQQQPAGATSAVAKNAGGSGAADKVAAAIAKKARKEQNKKQHLDNMNAKKARKAARKEAKKVSKIAKLARDKEKRAARKAKRNAHVPIVGGVVSPTTEPTSASDVALRRLQASLSQMSGPTSDAAAAAGETVNVVGLGSLFVVDATPGGPGAEAETSDVGGTTKGKKKKKKKDKTNDAQDDAHSPETEQNDDGNEDDDEDDMSEQPLKKMRSDPPVFELSSFAMEPDVFEEADKLSSVGAAIRDVLKRKAAAALALTQGGSNENEGDKDPNPRTTTKKRKADADASGPAPGSAPARIQLSKGPLDEITMVGKSSSSSSSSNSGAPRQLASAFDDEQARLRPPPWMAMDDPIWHRCRGLPELKLHNEIVRFTEFVSPTKQEQADREDMVKLISSIVHKVWPSATLEVFGSFSTDLCLPASDVDMVVFGCTPAKKAIYKLARALRDDSRVKIYRMQVIDKARVPIIKLELKDHKYQADICFDQDSGPATGKLIRSLIKTMPEVRSLTLLVKYFLAQRGLNETYMGGMGSYLCFLTVVSTVQHFRRRHRKALTALQAQQSRGDAEASAAAFEREWGAGLHLQHNLGRLVLEYFALYGKRLNFTTTAISLLDGGTYRPKTQGDLKEARNPEEVHRLLVENPRDASADVGRSSHKVGVVRRAFQYAHDVLSIYVGVDGPRSHGLLAAGRPRPESILEQIIFVDETLATRNAKN